MNCSCLSGEVRRGSCEKFCLTETFAFLSILFLVTFFQTLMATPQLMIVLRSVQHELQSFALGLENCIMKVLAQIPAPILFGMIIDNECLFWSQSTCDRRGSCFIYNGDRLPLTLFGTALLIKSVSLVLVLLLLLVTRQQRQRTNPPAVEQVHPLILVSSVE